MPQANANAPPPSDMASPSAKPPPPPPPPTSPSIGQGAINLRAQPDGALSISEAGVSSQQASQDPSLQQPPPQQQPSSHPTATSPSAQPWQWPQANQSFESQASAQLTDSPLPATPPGYGPPPDPPRGSPLAQTRVERVPKAQERGAMSQSPVGRGVYQVHTIRSQSIQIGMPEAHSADSETDFFDQRCRLLCCECPVWLCIVLTLVSVHIVQHPL